MDESTILCFGDSNTWGQVPGSKKVRYPRIRRWPGILQDKLGHGYSVLEEAQTSCTTVFDDPKKPFKNGLAYLIPCLESHAPLDIVVLFIGTNDLKDRFSLSAEQVASNIGKLVDAIQDAKYGRDNAIPKTIVVAPPPILERNNYESVFGKNSFLKSLELPDLIRVETSDRNCIFIDGSEHISTSEIDGVHIDEDQHHILAEILFPLILDL